MNQGRTSQSDPEYQISARFIEFCAEIQSFKKPDFGKVLINTYYCVWFGLGIIPINIAQLFVRDSRRSDSDGFRVELPMVDVKCVLHKTLGFLSLELHTISVEGVGGGREVVESVNKPSLGWKGSGDRDRWATSVVDGIMRNGDK